MNLYKLVGKKKKFLWILIIMVEEIKYAFLVFFCIVGFKDFFINIFKVGVLWIFIIKFILF